MKMACLHIAHMGRILSVKDCICLLVYPAYSCFLPISSSLHSKISFKPLYELIFCNAYFIFCKTLSSPCCIQLDFQNSLKGCSSIKRWSFEKMMQKPREGCSDAKTNQQLTFETNIFSRVKCQCSVSCCFSPSPFHSGIKD